MSHDIWGEAILMATYVLNKIPHKEKEETLYELWMGRKPSYQYLRVWGCLANVAVPTPKAQKNGPKSMDCIFIGYTVVLIVSLCMNQKNPDIQKNTIMESKNASFFEHIFPCLLKETGSSSRLDDEVVQDKRQRDDNDLQDERQDQTKEEEVKSIRSKRVRTEKLFGPDFVSFMLENKPTSYREAVTSSEGHQWKEAIKSEIDSILQNYTWELVDLPLGCKPLCYKLIFKKKMKANGTIDKYKTRLVIKGFRQHEGLDYFDIYSPVTRITSIMMILFIAPLRNLEVHQMDVITAFLNGDLEEEIYMNQPEGFIAPGQEGKVCRLVKSLYGLKQAPRQWHQKFDHAMLESRFKINECDKCVYVKDTNSRYVILCLYVDDMLIVDSNDKMIKSTKDMLKSKFDMKDMGLADVILGIKIIRTQNGLVLSQAQYMDKILNTYNAGDSDLARTLIDTSLHLSKIKGVGYSDANWISDIKDSRSTSGYVYTLGGAAISWKSSKQTVIAKSTIESEFIALDKCREKVEWLCQFVEDIPRMTNTQTLPLATTVVNPTGALITNTVANHAERPEKFNGQNFKRWQQKMFFYLTTLGLARFLKETVPQVEPPVKDPLYNVYCKTTTAKSSRRNVSTKQKMLVDFKNYLKHKRKEMSVEDLVVRLCIEEDNKLALKYTYTPDSGKANMIEHARSSSRSNPKGKGKEKRKNDKKNKGKSEYLAPKAGIMKQNLQGTCYNCDQHGHRAANCKMPKRVNPRQGNMVNDDVDMIAMVSDVCAIISEKLYMGNSATANIKGEGDVVLKITSEKELKLTDVLGYAMNGMFKLNVMVVKNEINKINSSTYLIESSNMWHGRLGHVVRSDRGGEYMSSFAELCAKHGIRHEFTAPYSPQQNGIAERNNRTLKEMVTVMLISSGMSQDIWEEAILTATYLLNKIPPKVAVPTPKAQKIRPKSVDCRFIGYAKNSSAYRFIVHESKNPDIQKNTMTKLSKIRDNEMIMISKMRDKIKPRKKKLNQEEAKEQETTNGHQWKEAIKSEIDSILQNYTWQLVDLPPGCKPLGYKWIFKKKIKADGTIDKYKARLSRYTSNPSNAHWKAITRISDIKDSRSTSGYVYTLGGAAISWKSSKQSVMAKSTMESKFITLDKCEEEIGALCSPRRELRKELKYVQSGVKMNKISFLKFDQSEAVDPFCNLSGKCVRSSCTTALDVVPWETNAIDEAQVTLKRAQGIESTYPNVPGKSLWGSCVDYFDGIVFTLNMVLDHTLEPTPLDVQTWLSAGLSYINIGTSDTPKFVDLNNSNKNLEVPDVVVALDGSGNFSSIQEAVDSAGSRRRGK
nr:retrotransposon protein, putative, Ty1-copia subclass [Tanacetum cinerariifolium]